MHRRTRALAISPEVKAKVWERDGGRCVLCGSFEAAPNAHFIPRSQGGLGIEENVLTLCLRCHNTYDNSPERWLLREELRAYLLRKYQDWDEMKLTYRKGF